jgi:putative acetyltransferase
MNFSNFETETAHPIIRPHRTADVEAMYVLRYVAVHQIAGDVYDRDILEGWAGKLETKAIEDFSVNLEKEIRLVVELGNKLIGYGAFRIPEPDKADIFGVYMLPGHERQGVGKQLLAALEDEARRRGLRQAWVTSPLNAIPFFEHSGYEFVTDGIHKLYNGSEVKCARLVKQL